MRLRTVSESTTQLTRYGFVNAFLVREPDGLTLVDTALNAAEQVLAAAAEPIRRIALTHGHGDHVGSLDALHLATALTYAEAVNSRVTFVTHDRELGKAAAATGLEVEGV